MSALGREIAPPVAIGRPRFRYYPGPPTAAIVALPFLALTLFGYLTFRASRSPGFFQFMAVCTALMIAMAVGTFLIWRRMGVTLSLRELGVMLNGREIRYAEIDAITVYDKRRYDETAAVRSLTRTITIETTSGKVKALYVALPQDALDDALETLVVRVAAESRARKGKGWHVEQAAFEGRGQRVPLSAISAAGVFEREVRLWQHREEHHFFSVPYDTRNARVLLALAERGASTAPAQAHAETAPAVGFGRLLFSRRTSLISGAGNTILAAFGLAMLWMVLEHYLHVPMDIAVRVAAGGFVLWIFYSLYRATVRYRFHERGLVRISRFGSRTLAYANVAAMVWSESSTTLEHAIPMGTTVKAKLLPDDGSRAVSIRLHRFRNNDGDLEPVRSAIARHVAASMHRRLERGEDVPWTDKATFTRQGIALKKEIVRYDQPIGVLVRHGYLMLYRESWRKPLVQLPVNGANFHPGLALFESLMARVVTQDEERSTA